MPAEIDPDMTILVPEQRGKGQVRGPGIGGPASIEPGGPLVPGFGRQRVRRRSERQDVEEQAFVVDVPVAGDEAPARMPAHRHDGRARGEPRPVDRGVDPIREQADAAFVGMLAVEPFAREQHAAEQQRGVDRRQFSIAETLPGLHVEEVVEEALMAADAARGGALAGVGEEFQRGERPRTCLRPRDPAARRANRIRRKREPHRRDRRKGRRRPTIGREPGRWIGSVPEEAEGALLDVRDQVARPRRRSQGSAGRAAAEQRGHAQPTSPDNVAPVDHSYILVSHGRWRALLI